MELDATTFLVFDGATLDSATKAKEHGKVVLPMGEEQEVGWGSDERTI